MVLVQDAAEAKASMTLWASIKAVEPVEATGWAVSVQDATEAKASAAAVKAVEPAEAIGAAVPEQDVAESRATAAGVKEVEPAEAIGVAVPEPNVAEATVVTLLRGIKENAAEKNTYIGISFTHPAARWDCPSCCRLY